MIRTLSALVLLLAAAAPARAQIPAPAPGGAELVDRVVAVVGDTALLLSDLQTAIQQQQAAGRPIPEDPIQREAFLNEILEERINTLLLIEAARDAGMSPDEARVNEAVDAQIARIVRNFGGSQQRLEAALEADGMTMTQYREVLRQQFMDDELLQTYMQSRMRGRARPVIDEDEIRAEFEARREALGMRPVTISFRQVVVRPEPSDSADAAARQQAQEVYQELQDGGDWDVLARRFSDDPGSREVGGDLGWVRQGDGLVQDFERMAFSIRPGMISPVFRSDFGYHVLQVRRTQGAERQVRHILIQPEIAEAEIAQARVRADSVAEALRGGANVTTLARAYNTPADQIDITPRALDQLPPDYAEALESAGTGEVVEPFSVPGTGAPNWAVVRVTRRDEERPFTLDDAREELVSLLQQNRMIEQMVEDLRARIHVTILL